MSMSACSEATVSAPRSVRAKLVMLAALVVMVGCACAPAGAASALYDRMNDPQACAENALRRSPDPDVVSDGRVLFSRGCAVGQLDSCSTLGVIHELGPGMPPDRERARPLYRRACEGGNARACGNLGELMLTDANPEPALALLEMACNAWQGRACLVSGFVLIFAN